MTKSDQDKIMKQQMKNQKEAYENDFKQKARFQAMSAAQYLRPPNEYIADPLSGKRQSVVQEAEKIYQWLIQLLK